MVTGRVTVTSPLPSGSTVMVQYWFVPWVLRWALSILPPVIEKAWSRRFAYPDLTLTLKSSPKVNRAPSWVVGTPAKAAVSGAWVAPAGRRPPFCGAVGLLPRWAVIRQASGLARGPVGPSSFLGWRRCWPGWLCSLDGCRGRVGEHVAVVVADCAGGAAVVDLGELDAH